MSETIEEDKLGNLFECICIPSRVSVGTSRGYQWSASTLSRTPHSAAIVSFSVGLGSLLFLALMIRTPIPQLQQIRQVPWYLFIGGVFGALMVSSAIIFIPKIGVTQFIGGIIVGQILAALALDHFGVLGIKEQPLNISRCLGAALLIIGFFLTRK